MPLVLTSELFFKKMLQVAGPLAFYSKKISSAESRYSAFDGELFAAYSALYHFQFLLEGKEFVSFT